MHPVSPKVKKTRCLCAFWLTAIIAILIMAGCGGGSSGDSSGGGGSGGFTPPLPVNEVQVFIESYDSSQCNDIKVYFDVVGPDGNAVFDDLGSSISLRINDSPMQWDGYTRPIGDSVPITMIFTMDYSGSMTAQAIAKMEEAVEFFILDMRPGDYGKIIKFNGEIWSIPVQGYPPTDDHTALLEFLDHPYVGDPAWTNIYDTADRAVTELIAVKGVTGYPERTAVIFLTDGRHNVSDSTVTVDLGDVIASAQANDIPFFSIGLFFKEAFDETDIKRLANETGGLYFRSGLDDLIVKYGDLSQILLLQNHVLTFDSTSLQGPEVTVEVEVQLGNILGSGVRVISIADCQ